MAYRNNAAVRLSDVADVQDSVEDLRNLGLANGKGAVLVILYRQPGANIIQTVDGVESVLPELRAALPGDVEIMLASDRSITIRGSLLDTQRTLLIAVGLVILVVFAFLRNARATLIPSVAVPISILGTFGAMYLLGYSLNNLSLMALTISTGFVVDDAIVVPENVSRHMEAGMPRMQAALLDAREVGFTVLTISLSLIAVFLPILLMGGIVGPLFREFAVTLSMSILVSLVISLTTTPMLCSRRVARCEMAECGERHHRLHHRAVGGAGGGGELNSEPILIAAALAAVYIVPGVLYESYVHPITILSTLPSAGVGAVLALLLFKAEFSIIALIGVILLIGIVKKNAIMMIDFALQAERQGGMSTLDVIRQACLMRFRPIMMTTFAATLGAVPLAIGVGEGSEPRQPLGISIVGGCWSARC